MKTGGHPQNEGRRTAYISVSHSPTGGPSYKILVKFVHVVPEICMWSVDRQTDRQTHVSQRLQTRSHHNTPLPYSRLRLRRDASS